MDIVNKTPSVVDIQRFPQREEELKKAKKKYPQVGKSFSDWYKELLEDEEIPNEENNVTDGNDTNRPTDKPERYDTPDENGIQKRLDFEEGNRQYGLPDKELDDEEEE